MNDTPRPARRRAALPPLALLLALVVAVATVATGCSSESEPAPSSAASPRAETPQPAATPAPPVARPAATPAPDEPPAAPLERVTLALNWFPEIEHGGYYEAVLKGYYREVGLDVTIIPGGPESAVVPRVATGQVTFGLQNADEVLLANAQGAEIVALFAPLQTSPRCIMVHADGPVETFDDLRRLKTLAMSVRSPFAQFLMKKLPLEGVEIVPYHGSVALFLTRPDVGQQGYSFSEPILAEQQGAEPRVLMVADLGFNPYSSVLVASMATVRDRSDVVTAMVAASAKGWTSYLLEPSDTNNHLERINREMTSEVLALGAQRLPDLCVTDETAERGVGLMSGARWRELHDQLVELGLIEAGAIDPTQSYRTYFLPGPVEIPGHPDGLRAPQLRGDVPPVPPDEEFEPYEAPPDAHDAIEGE